MGKSLKRTQSIADYMVMVICTISPRGKKKKKKGQPRHLLMNTK